VISPVSGGVAGAGRSGQPDVVQFSYRAVEPETVRIPADGSVTGVNAAQDTRAFVVFRASIASSFRCADLRAYFSKIADNVHRSLPITQTESDHVQLPCSLEPGTYDYEIWLVGSGFGTEGDADRPEQILRAKIVVE
jgi:hypothetical protein